MMRKKRKDSLWFEIVLFNRGCLEHRTARKKIKTISKLWLVIYNWIDKDTKKVIFCGKKSKRKEMEE
jgi:hypothetical protein